GEFEGAEWQILDVRDPALAEKLRGVDVVVRLPAFGPQSCAEPGAPATGVTPGDRGSGADIREKCPE
ncbi:hypothetical protein ACWEP3_25685, partial [Streptomyces albidoflavus]